MPTPIRLIITYLGTAIAFAAVDFVWLTQVGPKVYFPTLEPVALQSARMGPAVVFYLAYMLGLVALAIWPKRHEPLIQTTIFGGLLGAMCYATYDMTNQATLKVWATQITVADILWGTFVTAVGATVGGFILRKLTPAAA